MALAGTKRFSLFGAVGTSTVVAGYAAWLFSRGRVPDDGLLGAHHFVVTTLLATWLVTDAKDSRREYASFDHGWFALIMFPFYSAYYLISTRRWRRGTLILTGMIVLFFLPWLAQMLVWYVS